MYRQVYSQQQTSEMARYLQISAYLQQKIDAGDYLPGSRLPAEHDLGRQFGVNRHTAREALKTLRNDGSIYSIKGKGNFVADSKIRYRVSQKMRYSRSITEAGLEPATELISLTEHGADPYIADKLALSEGDPVLVLEILRYVNGVPFILATSILPAARFPGLADHLSGSFSLYSVLKERYDVDPVRSESVFEAVQPGERELQHLTIPFTVPVLQVRSVARDAAGIPVEYYLTSMRGDIGSMLVVFDEQHDRQFDKADTRRE
jgi:phosphonate metabolism transcriptional regulator PhnF